MRAPLRYGIAIFASYFVAWTVAYSVVTYNAVRRLDFSQYYTWLVLAWNFTGFEMVEVTWLLSIAIFIPLVIAAIFLVRRRARLEQASQRSETAVSSGTETTL
jgi:hypothetical protein